MRVTLAWSCTGLLAVALLAGGCGSGSGGQGGGGGGGDASLDSSEGDSMPGTDSGMVDSTTSDSSGGDSSAVDSSSTDSTSTDSQTATDSSPSDSAPGGDTGTKDSSSTDSSKTGDSGQPPACDGGTSCSSPSACPTQTTACIVDTCTSGCCGTANAAFGTPCTDHGGIVCNGSGTCVSTHCMDGLQDGDETDVDCGGATCSPCADGKKCLAGRDCVSRDCRLDICVAAVCGNGAREPGEQCDDGNTTNLDG